MCDHRSSLKGKFVWKGVGFVDFSYSFGGFSLFEIVEYIIKVSKFLSLIVRADI